MKASQTPSWRPIARSPKCTSARPVAEYLQERTRSQPENPFAALIPEQQIAVIPEFTLESGATLRNVPVAYTARGRLSPGRDNAMVICHALTGSADVGDWWGPLLGGPGKALDVSRFLVVCINSLGSPYGTASPVTAKDGDASLGIYGPEFPLTTIRDDVRLHQLLLRDLGVEKVATVVGGSMGGMLVLEWAYLGKDFVRSIVPIATSSRHSAWGISWGEAQRQSIYADPKYDDGYYSFENPPSAGLGAARMSALLTYRSRNSFESRFGRNIPDATKRQTIGGIRTPGSPSEAHFHIHNDGHNVSRTLRGNNAVDITAQNGNSCKAVATPSEPLVADPQFHRPANSGGGITGGDAVPSSTYFSAQSYLRYQGTKFVKRFDSNCYIAITRKLDTHDVSRNRATTIAEALAMIEQPALVLGIESDGLFTFAEQEELAAHIPNARLERIDSPEGHDAFLLQFEQVNAHILAFLHDIFPEIMQKEGEGLVESSLGQITKTSTFGEAEVEDITAW